MCTFLITLPGHGYQKRMVSISLRPSIETLNSPTPPFTVSICTPGAFLNCAATRAAMALLISQTGQ